MLIRGRIRSGAIVEFLFLCATGHAMVFEPGEFAATDWPNERLQFFLGSIEAGVAIEVAINRIARVAGFRAPDLVRGLAVARESSRTSRRVAGREECVTRPRPAEHETVRLDDEPTIVC